ncbi:queuine tRNA-ribosyltransferase accessory subunit 2-like isoform X3 [Corticium candelabrum]|uniref:queuine tRNA-ribosyltransferase accessory subunit 2-like isoform X3 n=1 Tax=Corticium candelabrum TaxID=121492 RepID=UPI002E25FE12|nr:queuine tRNA-ribosyltransferase accessory subunit 2-like isoform X3 [Corticium candelabrum]
MWYYPVQQCCRRDAWLHFVYEVLRRFTFASRRAVGDRRISDTKAGKIDVSTCCEKPGVQCLNSFQRGIRALAGLEGYLVFCAVQDVVDVARFTYNEEKTVSMWTVSGRHKFRGENYEVATRLSSVRTAQLQQWKI